MRFGGGTIRVGSLFSGIGGFEAGIEAAFNECGFPTRVMWQVEQADYPRAVLAHHWPDADRSITDVRNASKSTLSPVDLLVFGFPCPDISYNGRGAGIEGERSGLWVEGARVVREIKPRWIIVENVPALLSRGLGTVLRDLAALGYDARWDIISAKEVGFPSLRERCWVTAWREWSPIVRASDLEDCECCDGNDKWCERCECHYAECQCPGPHSHGDNWDIVEEPWGIVAYPDIIGMEGRWANWLRVASPYARSRLSGGCGPERRGHNRETLAALVRGLDGVRGGLHLSEQRPVGLGYASPASEPVRLITAKEPHWKERIMALGNVAMPQSAREVGRRLIEEGLLS